jgi:hypothetical protein
MILIISQDYDASTDRVIQWLDYYNVAYIRVNNSDKLLIENYTITNSEIKFKLRVNEIVIELNEIDYYWYRRGEISIDGYEQSIKTSNAILSNGLNRFLFNEKNKLKESLNYSLKDIPHLGSDLDNTGINKLEILKKAIKAGIIVPDTLIISKKHELVQFISKHKKAISKPINESVMIDTDDHRIYGYTRLITTADLKDISSDFSPTLFQKAIENFCELRVFYLEPRCYTMAIFLRNLKTYLNVKRKASNSHSQLFQHWNPFVVV